MKVEMLSVLTLGFRHCGNSLGMQSHSQVNDHISLPNANTTKSAEKRKDYVVGLLTSQRDN